MQAGEGLQGPTRHGTRETKRGRNRRDEAMAGMSDFAIEVAERIAGRDGDFAAVMDALLSGRVEFGAVGPSGRTWVADPDDGPRARDAVLELATAPGMGMVARLDGGEWVTIRELQPVRS